VLIHTSTSQVGEAAISDFCCADDSHLRSIHSCAHSHRHPGHGRWHAPSSRHLRALLSVCDKCSFGGLGRCSCRVCVSGVLFSVGVCVCDLLIFFHLPGGRGCDGRLLLRGADDLQLLFDHSCAHSQEKHNTHTPRVTRNLFHMGDFSGSHKKGPGNVYIFFAKSALITKK